MGLFNRKINHAVRVRENADIGAFFPYLSRTRAESIIYFSKQLDITNALNFINEKKRNGKNISLFNLIVTALAKVFEQRPMLNRFILGRRLYQRDLFDISYVIKKSLTDEGEEILTTIEFDKYMNLEAIAQKMNHIQDSVRNAKEENGLDRLLNFFGGLPRPLMRLVFAIVRFLDFRGMLPSVIRKELPFYCSIFISNLASIAVDAPFHHLYELGTTSIFLAIGKPYMSPVVTKEGTIEVHKVVNLNFTIDERICDGYYLSRSLDRFVKFMDHPEML